MKMQRQSAIRDLLGRNAISSQDALRRQLAGRGIRVTQATLSRDIRELQLFKGPQGYALPQEGQISAEESDALPAIADLLLTFGVEVRQAANLLVLLTARGAAQPVAAGIDDERWPECLGTIAGDNTVLLVCSDQVAADTLYQRLQAYLV